MGPFCNIRGEIADGRVALRMCDGERVSDVAGKEAGEGQSTNA